MKKFEEEEETRQGRVIVCYKKSFLFCILNNLLAEFYTMELHIHPLAHATYVSKIASDLRMISKLT